MPIIDNISYPPDKDTPQVQKQIIIQFPLYKSFQERTRTKMLRSYEGNGIIRPRKVGTGWTGGGHNNKTPIFKLGDGNMYKDHQLAIPEMYDPRREKKLEHSSGTKKNLNKKVMNQIGIYLEKSTLHGLRYIGDPSLSIGERCFWFVAFASAIGFAGYFIMNIYDKWNSSPVIISFSPFDASLIEIPFPAVTICNMNQAKKSEAEHILHKGSESEKRLLSDLCNSNSSFNDTEQAPAWDEVRNFLVRAGQSCSDMLKTCEWQSERVSCEDFFNNELTDEGLCCSFNRLPPVNIFRNQNDVAILNQTYTGKVYDWSPEKGFPKEESILEYDIPRRPLGAGTHLGLTVVVDAQVSNYFCSSTDSIGFKIIISNPLEAPKMADFGYLVSPGVEARYALKVDIREATDTLRNVPIEKRQCYFSNERPLHFFRVYTERNCRLECQSKYTLSKCYCIPYYLPKSKLVTVCGKRDEICSNQAKADMELTFGNGSSCNCLPGCFETIFDKSSSTGKLSNKLNTTRNLDNISQEYFVENMAVLHFFFKESKFRKQLKSEIYGFTEVLSNIGGLLGLCMGFSFLSFIELLYFLTLRVLCGLMKMKRQEAQQRKRKHDGSENKLHSIPFVR